MAVGTVVTGAAEGASIFCGRREKRQRRGPDQGCQVQQFLNPKLVKLVGPTFIAVGLTIADCGYFP